MDSKNQKTSADYYSEGLNFLNSNKLREAAASFEKAVELDTQNANAFNNWGVALDRQGKFDEAIEKYKKATEVDPKHQLAWSNWGIILENQGNFQEAIEKYKKTIEIDPKDKLGYHSWGLVLGKQGNYEDAIEKYKKVIEIDQQNADAYNDWGVALDRQGKFDEAIEKYKKAIEINSEHDLAWSNWGIALEKQGGFEEAIEKYKKAIEINPKNYSAFYGWGNAHLSLLQYEEALEKYEKSWNINPDNNDPYPYHNYAHTCDILGKYKTAKEKWRKALGVYLKLESGSIESKNSDYLYYSGTIHHQIYTEIEEAERLYMEVLKIDPQDTDTLLELCRLYFEMKTDEIELNEESRSRRNSAHIKAWNKFRSTESILKVKEDDNVRKLAQLYSIAGDHNSSEEYWLKYLEKKTDDSGAFASLGLVQMNLEKYKKSISSYENAVKLSPDNLDYRCNLAKAYLYSGSYTKSEFEYQKVLEVSAGHMDSILGISELYSKQGDSFESKNNDEEAEEKYSQAMNYLNEALELAEGDYESNNASKKLNKTELSELYYSLGYVYAKLHELQKRKDNNLLTIAINNFKKVKLGTVNYYKANRAIKKINERISEYKDAGSRRGALLVVIIAVVLLILSQVSFYFGRPVILNTSYSINEEKLNNLIKNESIGLSPEDLVSLVNYKSFSSEDITEFFTNKIKIDSLSDITATNIIEMKEGLFLKEFSPIDSTLYATLTFGSIIFIIAGLYLKELSKLRLGAIELEKTTGQQVTLSSSLGIGPAGK